MCACKRAHSCVHAMQVFMHEHLQSYLQKEQTGHQCQGHKRCGE